MTYRPILASVYCGTCGNIHACIQNQCSAIALRRHVFLELYDDAFLGLVFKTGFPHCLNMLWTTIFNFLWVLGPFWFWFIVGLPEMRWPACPTLCIADGLQFILQIWQCFCFFFYFGNYCTHTYNMLCTYIVTMSDCHFWIQWQIKTKLKDVFAI